MVPWFVSNAQNVETELLGKTNQNASMLCLENAQRKGSLIFPLTLRGEVKPVPLSKAKNLNKYQRVQTKLKFSNLFPKPRRKGKCRCGCSKEVSYPRRLWASDACNKKAWEYYAVIKGYRKVIKRLLWKRDKGICAECGKECHRREWDADHILSVAEGGGGCDLTNFQTLCKKCHKKKTARLMKRLR